MKWLQWLQWNPDRNGAVRTFAAFVLVVSLFALLMIYFPVFPQRSFNAGFGPDWECADRIRGDPICIRKLGK